MWEEVTGIRKCVNSAYEETTKGCRSTHTSYCSDKSLKEDGIVERIRFVGADGSCYRVEMQRMGLGGKKNPTPSEGSCPGPAGWIGMERRKAHGWYSEYSVVVHTIAR